MPKTQPAPPAQTFTGLSGAALTSAGVTAPYVAWLTLLFLLTGPASATWPPLPSLAPPTRAIVCSATTSIVNTAVAQLMFSLDRWSPRHGVTAVLPTSLTLALISLLFAYRTTRRTTSIRTEEHSERPRRRTGCSSTDPSRIFTTAVSDHRRRTDDTALQLTAVPPPANPGFQHRSAVAEPFRDGHPLRGQLDPVFDGLREG